MEKFWLVLLAGGLGSVCRVYLSEWVSTRLVERLGWVFPWGTLTVNVLGCFLIGVLAGLAQESALIPPAWRLILVAGFVGGFTTFSAFAYESWMLGAEGALLRMAANILLSVLLGLLAVMTGLLLVRMLTGRFA